MDEKLVDSETFMALVDKVIVGEELTFFLKDGSEGGDKSALKDAPSDGDEAQETKSSGDASLDSSDTALDCVNVSGVA